ncbi:MAG: hypothetical protein GX452_13950 [Ignavibacteriales bacterium]|nr:hypothetical protein [Ignavibacteriales bacterium]
MKVKFMINAIEGGTLYKIGDIADIPETRVADYGPYVEIIVEKSLDEPEKDKMVKKAKKK